MAANSGDRVGRLLNLVPYLLARPGIEIAHAAVELDVTEKQLREDLELLWVCGLPGYGPGDLIDLAFDGDRVTVTYDAGMDRPLRLTPDEALALIVALRMLAEMPGIDRRDSIERALAKVEHAAGDVADAPVAVRLPGDQDRLATIRHAVEARQALRITYYTAARDETSERVIDPMRVLLIDGRAYLEAWCRRADAVRLFRVDRIDGLTVLDEAAVLPRQARPSDVREGAFRASPDQPLVTLRVGRGARWITEYYPCESVRDADAEQWIVTMRVSDLTWARRLVLGLGPEVCALAPPALVDDVREETRRTLAAYAAANA